LTAKRGEQKKTTSKADKPKKPAPTRQPTLAEQTKPVKEKTSNPTPLKKTFKGKVMKVRKENRSDHLVDEEDEEPQPVPEPQIEDDEYNLKRWTLVTEEASTGPSAQPQDDKSTNVVRDTPSPADAKTGADTENSNSEGDTEILNVDEEQGDNVSYTVTLEERTIKLDERQAGSDPGNTLKSRPLPDEDQAGSNPGPSHVALVGPNPEPMHKDFITTVYPKVYESLKHTTEEHVFLENPPSLSVTLSSMKDLDDAFTYCDQFLNDKPTEKELGKANVEAEVESMVTVPIHQTSSSVPLLSTPVIDLTPSIPVSPLVQETVFTTTTTLLLPPSPPPQQSTSDSALAACVSALENICANLNVKEAVQNALQAPVRERSRELSEFEMKEILRDRMFESGSYKSHSEHITLYDALETSMDRENREEFVEATAKSRKRRRDDQDPPPPPSKDLDQNKKRRHDSDTSASKQS
ncbi:hypothetical protein Tco_1506720, partial [Tanacetum coccineum]